MLLIGDIHINTKHAAAILDTVKNFIQQHADEKNIIFLGDFMYMFSYDRQALGELFDLFLLLWKQDKSVYILCGNHDWLSQHFIYHEGKKVADILNQQADNRIHFITTPETHTIEGKQILFMPYNKSFLSEYYRKMSPKATVPGDRQALLESQNLNEQLSGALNHYLATNYIEGTTIIHHYYTANTRFPGQDAIFYYKDIALDPTWMTKATRVISGHIHKAFAYQHYLCTGSVWYTTSGERDHCKRLWQRDSSQDIFIAHEVSINPYYTINDTIAFTSGAVLEHMETIREHHKSLLCINNTSSTNSPSVIVGSLATYSLANTTLLLYTQQNTQDIEERISPELRNTINDIQLKYSASNHKDMTELLDISQYNVQQSLLDRKSLVKKYLMSRYGDESEKYRTLLSELNIL